MVFRDPQSFLDDVEAVATAGGRAVMRFWRTLEPSQVTEKARNDLVSAADHAAESAIVAAIHERYPDHSILAEETGWSHRDHSAPIWLVDPLDGTANFVHGIPQFAVSVAVSVAGEVRFGVILDPLKGDVFRSARGHGAWWNGRQCRVSERNGLGGALLATGFPFRAHELLDGYLRVFKDVFLRCTAIRRQGSAALDLAYTAAGLFDGFFEFRLAPWDVAAGSLLVEEAGGVITDADGGASILEPGDVLCGSPGVHRELLEIVTTHRSSVKTL